MREDQQLTFGLPKPGRALIGAMLTVSAIWVFFAVGLNWAKGSGEELFTKLVGSDDILHGEIWRLFTSFLLHQPTGPGSVGHLLTTLFGLYFLGASLEERWGKKRFISFLLIAGVLSSALQVVVGSFVDVLHAPQYFGALGVIDAIAIAWALSFRGRQVRLFFVLPVSGNGMIIFIFAMNLLYVIAMEQRRDGLVTPFGGMLAGFLFAEGSPVRRAYLQWKLSRLQAKTAAGLGAAGSLSGGPSHSSFVHRRTDDEKPNKRLLN